MHLLTAPYSPTTTGKVERFHKTLRVEFDTRQGRNYSGSACDVLVSDKLLQFWVGNELLKTVARTSTGEIRNKHAGGTAKKEREWAASGGTRQPEVLRDRSAATLHAHHCDVAKASWTHVSCLPTRPLRCSWIQAVAPPRRA